MKSQKDFRNNQKEAVDVVRKAIKLDPIRKSGKEKHEIYKGLNQEDDEVDDYKSLKKRESVLDYMGDDEDEDFEEDYEEDYEEEYEDEEEDEEEDIDRK